MVTDLATVVGCHLLKMWFLLKMMKISMFFVENTSRDVPQRPMKHVYIYIYMHCEGTSGSLDNSWMFVIKQKTLIIGGFAASILIQKFPLER